MIIDTLAHCEQYHVLGARYQAAFEWLKQNDVTKMEPGQYDIDGDNVFVLVQEYDTLDIEDCWFESHIQYVDLHYIADGFENFGYAPIERVSAPTQEYSTVEDDILYRRECQYLLMQPGDFVITFPQDVHMPRKMAMLPSKVRKACIKIRIKEGMDTPTAYAK